MAETNAAALSNGPGQMRDEEVISSSYRVMVSPKFVVLSLLSSMLLAFTVGRAARHVLVEGPKNALLLTRKKSILWEVTDGLPSLLTRDGNKIPRTRYLSKNFDTSRSASSSSWLAKSRESAPSAEDKTCHPNECEDVERPLPIAAHLMVDIKRVDGAFLNSESRLANAMLEVVNEAELTLLSYHCHGLVPMGVSCVGVLLQNYMSFHTWPEKGVITLDLCVGGTADILPVLSIIERSFGVPQTGRTLEEKPEMRWAHKVRGFAEVEKLLLSTDLGLYVVNNLNHDVKEVVSLI
jgi:S-adenosylmethionine/arginine decarboxylase-like enzyme